LAGLTNKKGANFTDAIRSVAARKATPDENRVFEQFVSGFETNMARALGGGYAGSSTKVVMDNYHNQVAIAGDSPMVKAAFLARIKQELGILGDAFGAHPGANPAMVRKFKELNNDITSKIKFNVSDITTALNSLTVGPQKTQAEAGLKLLKDISTKTANRGAGETYEDPAKEARYQRFLESTRSK
jgi:hypothetical protein